MMMNIDVQEVWLDLCDVLEKQTQCQFFNNWQLRK